MPLIIQKARNTTFPHCNCAAFFLLFLLFILSCSFDTPVGSTKAHILFPKTGAEIIYGNELPLEADEDVNWYSDKDGFLGTGKRLLVLLSQNTHTISIEKIQVDSHNSYHDSIEVTIRPIPHKNIYCLEVQGASPHIFLPSGEYSPFVVSLFNSGTELRFSSASPDFSLTEIDMENQKEIQLKDKTLWNTIDVHSIEFDLFTKRSILTESTPMNTRSFHFRDFSEKFDSEWTEITAEKYYSSDNLEVWIDSNSQYDNNQIKNMIAKLESGVLVRHSSIWGDWNDINGDEKFSLLFSPLLNESNQAIGYFNPADFFLNTSENPYSNEMDVLYIAIPETGDDTTSAYSLNSIIATVVHEFQHLKSFSRSYEQYTQYNLQDIKMEEIFLEEGMAHLAESLSGYGQTGGNLGFVSRYLESTHSVSLSSFSTFGVGDSIERRGGMAILLSWLFWEKGGMLIHTDGTVTDTGGIQFIENYYNSMKRGWERIEDATNISRDTMLYNFAQYLAADRITEDIQDPITNEPITINPYCGILTIFGNEFQFNGPNRIDLFSTFNTLPYSITFGQAFSFTGTLQISIQTSSLTHHIRAFFER